MVIYIVVFIVSAFFIYLGEKTKSKLTRRICIFIALFLPSILAGLRDSSIGTDYEIYGISTYERALSSSSLINFFAKEALLSSASDYGYKILIYGCSLISKNYQFGMFVVQFITVSFIYAGMTKFKDKYGISLWFTMLLYYLSLYNPSLNIMRQMLAVAVAFYAFTFVWEKKYLKYVIFTIIAFLFHSSAIISLAVLVFYKILESTGELSEKKQLFRGTIIVAIIGVAILSMSRIVELLVGFGILNSNFLNYLAGGEYSTISSGVTFSVFELTIQIIYMLAFIFYFRVLNRRRMDALFFTMCSLMVLIINVFSPLFARYIFRMGYYFVPYQMVGLSSITKANKKESKLIWMTVLLVLVFVAWYRLIVLQGGHETVPYKFFWN